jgi:hypothetical protein
MAGSSSLARTNGIWPLCDASGSYPRAEQRESKLVVEVGVWTKALQQRAVLLGVRHLGTTRCHFSDIERILLDWIHGLLMAAAGNVIVLSSIEIGGPARKEGREPIIQQLDIRHWR